MKGFGDGSGTGFSVSYVPGPVGVQNRYEFSISSRTGMGPVSVPGLISVQDQFKNRDWSGSISSSVWFHNLIKRHYRFSINSRNGVVSSGTVLRPLCDQNRCQERYKFGIIFRIHISSKNCSESDHVRVCDQFQNRFGF